MVAKNYKEYEKISLGGSDIASLTMVGFKNNIGATAELLQFNVDGEYSGYLVDKNAEIKSHYNKVATFNSWLKIFDDTELVQTFSGEEINIFRAGNLGCIIQVVD